MADTDQIFHIANEATVTLRNLARRLREGADVNIVADQADEDADSLFKALQAANAS
jgi:hypothetical protein